VNGTEFQLSSTHRPYSVGDKLVVEDFDRTPLYRYWLGLMRAFSIQQHGLAVVEAFVEKKGADAS